MPLRVAMLGQYPLDETRVLGGVEAVMVPLVRGLAGREGLELHVVTCLPGVQSGSITTSSGTPLHVLQRHRLGRATWHTRDVWGIARTIRSISPDVVHAQGLGIYAAAAARGPWPHVITTHGIVFREAEFATGLAGRWRGFMDSRFERYCLPRAHAFISISPYVEQEMARIGGIRGTVYRIENPVDDAFFSVDRLSDGPTVLYAGRVIPRKGLLELLRAMAEVRPSVPQARLRVAGETESAPAYLEACRQFIAQQGLDDAVRFLGPLTVAQMVEEYARCAVLALTSKQETAPVAVAEAMAAARPVVATRVCGVPYMVEEGRSGLLVEHGDTRALAQALTRVLTDEAQRARMGRRAREIAQARFRTDYIAAETHSVYQQILSNHGAAHASS